MPATGGFCRGRNCFPFQGIAKVLSGPRGKGAARAVALACLALAGAVSCRDGKKTIEVKQSALNPSPKTSDFVIEARNSVRLQTGAWINGGTW